MPDLPGKNASFWVESAPPTAYPALEGSLHADVVIVGAGIVGLTAALSLLEDGRSVIVVEALSVGGQVTGRSSAKITTQHGLIYDHLVQLRGREVARCYAEANRAGADRIAQWVAELGIDCDLETRDAYAYASSAATRLAIEKEATTARELGFEAEVLDRAPLPFETAGALCFPGQAQFNPARYLVGLARAVAARGGQIFERSRARLIDAASRWRVVTDGGTVHAEHLLVATNMTVKSPVGMAKRTQPRCHTAIGFRVDDPKAVDGMLIGLDEPTHSIRMGRDRDGPLMLVLGPKFNTGHDGDVARRFRALEQWARQHLPVGDAAWRWCNEDYDTADRVPFAGEADPEKAPGFHIVTGLNGWGISNGTAAGMMVAGLIGGRPSPWQALYDPSRPYPEDFHKDGESQSVVAGPDDIRPGGGGVILRGEERIAAWRDEDGELHCVSAACTHKGCTVTWNNADRTWDCPCHGSIFAADGSVLHGPARKPLKPATL